jgi:hypothetical protein
VQFDRVETLKLAGVVADVFNDGHGERGSGRHALHG